MPNNINAAYRVRELLMQVQHQPNRNVGELWASLFNIAETCPNKRNFEVSRCLNQLHEEIELVRDQMLGTKYSESLYTSLLDKANNVVAVQNISGTWDSYKTQITPDLILCLGFCSEILDSEENKISDEQIQEILVLLQPLEEQLGESGLPPYIAKIVKKHIEKIKEAVHSYPITGVKALNGVVQAAYGEVLDNLAVFEESKETEEVKAISKVWQKIKEISNAASTVEKGVSSVYKLADRANNALEFFQGFIG
jgi:hypothetical protein